MPFELKNQFSSRLSDDELDMLKESLIDIIPEVPQEQLTTRKILVRLIELATTKVKAKKESQPEDLEKIKLLEGQVQKLQKALEEQADLADKLQMAKDENDKLEEGTQLLLKEKRELEEKLEKASGSVQQLEKFKPVENEMRIVLTPFIKEVLIRYARKASKFLGKEVNPGTVLTSLFARYITKKEVELEGFPFYIKDSELKSIKESQKKPANEPTQ